MGPEKSWLRSCDPYATDAAQSCDVLWVLLAVQQPLSGAPSRDVQYNSAIIIGFGKLLQNGDQPGLLRNA